MSDRPLHDSTPVQMNRQPSHQDSQKVRLILTKFHGLALVAAEPIQAGEKLLAFDGPVYQWGETTKSLPNTAPLFLRDHCIQIGEGLSRDAVGLARYANHSCEPNCGITDEIWITAMQDIAQDAELTWDYAMTEDNDWSMECGCGTPNCRKLITGYRDLPEERRKAYAGFVADWLLERDGSACGKG
jgi:uncharacterized protein